MPGAFPFGAARSSPISVAQQHLGLGSGGDARGVAGPNQAGALTPFGQTGIPTPNNASDLFQFAMSQLNQGQGQAFRDLQQQFAGARGRASQGLANSGLGNTTVRQNIGQGLAQTQADATARLRALFAQQRVSAGTGIINPELNRQIERARAQAATDANTAGAVGSGVGGILSLLFGGAGSAAAGAASSGSSGQSSPFSSGGSFFDPFASQTAGSFSFI